MEADTVELVLMNISKQKKKGKEYMRRIFFSFETRELNVVTLKKYGVQEIKETTEGLYS